MASYEMNNNINNINTDTSAAYNYSWTVNNSANQTVNTYGNNTQVSNNNMNSNISSKKMNTNNNTNNNNNTTIKNNNNGNEPINKDANEHATGNNTNENFMNKDGRVIDGVLYPKPERKIDVQGYETTKHALRFHGSDWDIPLTQKRDDLTKCLIEGAADATGEPEDNIQNVRFVVNSTYLYTKFTVRHKVNISLTEIQKKLANGKWTAIKQLYEPRQKKSRMTSELTREHSSSTNNKGVIDKQRSRTTSNHANRVNNTNNETNLSSVNNNNSNYYANNGLTNEAVTGGGGAAAVMMMGNDASSTAHNISFFGRANVGPEGPMFVDDIDRDEEPPNFQDPEVIKMRSKSEHLAIRYNIPA